jgi:hypothetical protein
MSYDQARIREQMRLLQPARQRFVQNYQPDLPTIIFLPGGMASSLLQANQKYTGGSSPFAYNWAWLPPTILCDGAQNLAMNGDVDLDDKITIALDTIGFAGVTFYSIFEWWCANQFNLFILGWDWRRRLEYSVDFIKHHFLPALRKDVHDVYGVDPLNNYFLVSHSFGGLVLKLFLNGGGKLVDNITRAITVAAPFYGYGGSQHFYFSGFSYLHPPYKKSDLARIIGSMQGGYTLFFLDYATYQRDRDCLENDPAYPLTDYPSYDPALGEIVDPYNPLPTGRRYPGGGLFNMSELSYAQQVRQCIVSPLPDPVNAKFFNVRGVQTNLFGPLDGTIAKQTWDLIKPGFNPDRDPDPIHSAKGRGDDTVPAWSARLCSTPAGNVVTVVGDLVEHMTLMDNPDVLSRLENLMLPPSRRGVAERIRRTLDPRTMQTASKAAMDRFLGELRARTKKGRGEAARFVSELSTPELQSYVRRFFKYLLKQPE